MAAKIVAKKVVQVPYLLMLRLISSLLIFPYLVPPRWLARLVFSMEALKRWACNAL